MSVTIVYMKCKKNLSLILKSAELCKNHNFVLVGLG